MGRTRPRSVWTVVRDGLGDPEPGQRKTISGPEQATAGTEGKRVNAGGIKSNGSGLHMSRLRAKAALGALLGADRFT
jgi:hypothetical protein